MTMVRFGSNVYCGGVIYPPVALTPAENTDSLNPRTINTTAANVNSGANQVAVSGRVIWKDGGTKDLHKIHWVMAGGANDTFSKFRVSIQDTSLVATAPMRPDGTEDQYTEYTGVTFPADGWVESTLNADRSSVANGSLLSIKWYFNDFQGGSSFKVGSLNSPVKDNALSFCRSQNSGSTWLSNLVSRPQLLFEASDGTFGWMAGCVPVTASANTLTFDSSSASNALATCVVLHHDIEIIGYRGAINCSDFAEFDLKTEAAGSGLVVNTTIHKIGTLQDAASVTYYYEDYLPAPVTLVAGTYYCTVEPTTTTTITVPYFSTPHIDAFPLGTDAVYATRLINGTWNSTVTTQRPYLSWIISGIDIPAGGGGLAQVMGGCQ